ncbi:MAG: CheD, stimulates methylation of protein [Gemmatimonadetes bacterium]|nr:CheD, stimulates methylation of protein [Gemmatimonadota bacterium]
MTARQTFVKVAQHAVGGREDTLITLGLGSCVAIMLHDRATLVGGMAHVLLPEPSLARDASNPSKFATSAVPLLMDEIRALGGSASRLEARLVGGASMFTSLMGPGSLNMGERNIRASREALKKANIPILAEEVGRDYGRSVRYWIGESRIVVTSVGRPDIVL